MKPSPSITHQFDTLCASLVQRAPLNSRDTQTHLLPKPDAATEAELAALLHDPQVKKSLSPETMFFGHFAAAITDPGNDAKAVALVESIPPRIHTTIIGMDAYVLSYVLGRRDSVMQQKTSRLQRQMERKISNDLADGIFTSAYSEMLLEHILNRHADYHLEKDHDRRALSDWSQQVSQTVHSRNAYLENAWSVVCGALTPRGVWRDITFPA